MSSTTAAATADTHRGANRLILGIVLAVISFWLVGFTVSYVLGFPLRLGAVGVWIGLSCSVVVFAVFLILRFRWLTGRDYLPELVRS